MLVYLYLFILNILGDRNDTLVTASHAIYHSEERQGQKSSAPAAVVGMQFRHSALAQLFRNITSYVN